MPAWALSDAGDLGRDIYLGHSADGPISFRAKSMTLPACERCNREYSILEGSACKVLRGLVSDDSLQASALLCLMDWMDKVRVGFWRYMLVLHKNPLGIVPNYAISQRIGSRDHLLYVARSSQQSKRITWGTQPDPVFHVCPSFFSLTLNGVSLVSYSRMSAAQRLVLPFRDHATYLDRSGGSPRQSVTRVVNSVARERQAFPLWPRIHALFACPRPLDGSADGSILGHHTPFPFQLYSLSPFDATETRPKEVLRVPTHDASLNSLHLESGRLLARIRLFEATEFRRGPVIGPRWMHKRNAQLAQLIHDTVMKMTEADLDPNEMELRRPLNLRSTRVPTRRTPRT